MDEEVDSSEVGSSGKVSLPGKVAPVLFAVEAGAVKEGFGFLPSRRVLDRAIYGVPSKAVRVRVLEAGQRRIRSGFAPCLAGRSGQSVGRVVVRCRRRVGFTKLWWRVANCKID